MNEFLGVIKTVSPGYLITADIPGIFEGVKAYPGREILDEPLPGDKVILTGIDPNFNSYFLYKVLKEDDFIGFRARGKIISMDNDRLVVGLLDGRESGSISSSIIVDSSGTIYVNTGKAKVKINGETYSSVRSEPLESLLKKMLKYLGMTTTMSGEPINTSANFFNLINEVEKIRSNTIKLE